MTADPVLRSHAPEGYDCPFCGLVAGDVADPANRCELGDTVYQDADLIVLIEFEAGSAEEKREYIESDPALKDLTAVRDGAFVTIPFSASTPGPRTVEGAERLADHLADD